MTHDVPASGNHRHVLWGGWGFVVMTLAVGTVTRVGTRRAKTARALSAGQHGHTATLTHSTPGSPDGTLEMADIDGAVRPILIKSDGALNGATDSQLAQVIAAR
jgi:hypothetical protein